METAPLIRAYDHAKVRAHVLAAGEFANAARHTSSIEALRTLKLLEEHHRRIAELVRIAAEQAAQPDGDDDAGPDDAAAAGPAAPTTPGGGDVELSSQAGAAVTSSSGSIPAATTFQPLVATETSVPRLPQSEPHEQPQQEQPQEQPRRREQPQEQDQQQQEQPQDQQQQRQPQRPQQHPPSSVEAAGPGQRTTALASALAQKRRVIPVRDLTPSLASNLASARGIRSKQRGQTLNPSVSNDQAPGSIEVPARATDAAGKVRKPPPPHQQQKQKQQKQKQKQPEELLAVPERGGPPGGGGPRDDSGRRLSGKAKPHAADQEGYSRFYNTFGSILSRISAPLAFAGLPLISEESPGSAATTENVASPPSRRVKASAKPRVSGGGGGSGGGGAAATESDITKIYSKATLRAIGNVPRGLAPQDSFFVVPPTGHTASYANILNYAEKEKRRMGITSAHGSDDDDDDDFVDARDTQAPLSPGARRRAGRARTEKELNNTIEELYLENRSLKDALDNLSKRLHAFEASAQNSHMALAESMRLMRPGSPVSVSSGGGMAGGSRGEESLRGKIHELEEQLAVALRDNEKKQKTLNRYREKWEVLKAGARARREAQAGVESSAAEQ